MYILNYAKWGKRKNSQKSSFMHKGVLFIRVRIYVNKRHFSSSPAIRMDRNSDDSGIDDVEPSSPVSSDEGNNGPTGQNVNNGVGDTNNRNVGQSTVVGQGGQTGSEASSGQNRGQPSNLTPGQQNAAGWFYGRDFPYGSAPDFVQRAIHMYKNTIQYSELQKKNAKVLGE